ncbi:MAG: pyridoxamine 5'-phosphate oxidase [Verrucomicrobiota bacterium]
MPEAESNRPSENVADLRVSYQRASLDVGDVADCPLEQFQAWFDEAAAAEIVEPNAMMLSTVGEGGQPSSRTVLLKGIDEQGFRFFTNYESRKGREMAKNSRVAAVFLWKPLERQVLVRGSVEKISREDSDNYFQSRPYGHQIGAWASRQSEVIPDRDWMEARDVELREKYPEGEVPLPDFWGGYVIRPVEIEFWQGRPSRLHDRILFQRQPDGVSWEKMRLSP